MEQIVAIIGAVGGTAGLIELAKYLVNRRSNARIADAEADISEFHVLQETMGFLQEQLKSKEERFAEQTQLVREQNRDLIRLEHEIADLKLELTRKRCDDLDCPFRLPPNAYTPPKKGLTKEEYHK